MPDQDDSPAAAKDDDGAQLPAGPEKRAGADRRQGDRRESGFITKVFGTDEVLLKEGENCDAAFLIRSGKVEIRKGPLNMNPKTLAVLEAGDVLGEMSLINDRPHIASAVATEETEVSVISKDEFKRRLDEVDPIMRGVLKLLVKRLSNAIATPRVGEDTVNWGDWQKKPD